MVSSSLYINSKKRNYWCSSWNKL